MKPNYGRAHHNARAELLANDPWCAHCGRPATVADHQPPIALHDHVDGSGCCIYVPSCLPCSQIQAGQVKALAEQERLADALPIVTETVEPIEHDDAVWLVPWLDDLRDVPADASWPRFMSAPHPRAVGSVGHLVEASAIARTGRPLRWWQVLVARRMLEVDVDGWLVWREVLLTVARRAGKSWLLRELAWWRLNAADHFGEPQEVLHVARTLSTALEVARPCVTDARNRPERYGAKGTTGREEISAGDSRWFIRSETSAYGLGGHLAVVDEAWDVAPETVAEGIQPTTLERPQAQLLLVSTAHRQATALMPERRARALDELRDPARRLILEWSADPHLPASAERAWRQASPCWDRTRADGVADAYADAIGAERRVGEPDPIVQFRGQYLNAWSTARRGSRGLDEPLLDDEAWSGAELPGALPVDGAVYAVEDWFGNGAAVAWCGQLDDGRLVVGGLAFDRRSLAYGYLAERADALTVAAGVSIAGDPDLRSISWQIKPTGSTETRAGLSKLREMIAVGSVVHDGSIALAEQIAAARVREAPTGLLMAGRERSDLLRSMVWALMIYDEQRGLIPAVS